MLTVLEGALLLWLAAAQVERPEPDNDTEVTCVTYDEELETIARDYAARDGWNEKAYDLAEVRRDGDVAWLLFQGRSMRPGDHFSVGIRTGSCTVVDLIPGR